MFDDADTDPRPAWQIAAEEGTSTAAIRELLLDNWPNMAETEAARIVRNHRKAHRKAAPTTSQSPERLPVNSSQDHETVIAGA